MKKQMIYHWTVIVCLIGLGFLNIYEYINTGRIMDMYFAISLFSLGAVRGVRILKKDNEYMQKTENDKSSFHSLVLIIVLTILSFAIPNLSTTSKTYAEKDYASMLSLGRPTSYFKHIASDDFNELYQQLLDNNWSNFRLPDKVIAGNSTVRSVSVFEDNITVEYGERFNTTVRFVQNRRGITNNNGQFTKLAEKEYIADTLTEEIQIGKYSVTQRKIKICSDTMNNEYRTVYSYSWKTGNYSYFIETTCDMEKDFDEMQAMIESMCNIDVRENP